MPIINLNETVNDPEVVIPDKFLINSEENPIKAVVDVIYPDIAQNIENTDFLRERSILTSTNAIVSDINSYIIDHILGLTHTYYSQESLSENVDEEHDFGSAFPVEYLNSINMPCLPKHDLKIKVGCVVMLMRNLNQIMGLCNGTRMVVKKMYGKQ